MDGNSTSPPSTSRARALPPLHAVERGGTTESRAGQIMAVAGPFCSSGLQITKLPEGCQSVGEFIEQEGPGGIVPQPEQLEAEEDADDA